MVAESPLATGALVVLGVITVGVSLYRLVTRPERRLRNALSLVVAVGFTALALVWFLDATGRTTSLTAALLLVVSGLSFLAGLALLVVDSTSNAGS